MIPHIQKAIHHLPQVVPVQVSGPWKRSLLLQPLRLVQQFRRYVSNM